MRLGKVAGAAAVALALIGAAHAESLPLPGRTDARIRTAVYRSDEVYRLYAAVGYAIELIFAPGETFAGEAGGDLDGIAIGSHTNHVIVKPKAANVGTNLIIYTNRHAYRFQYSASLHASEDPDDLMYAVRFIYPPPPTPVRAAAGPTPAQRVQHDFVRAETARPRNTDYWYCGSQALRPIAASDDGVQTRLIFGARSQLPAIFLENADGSESLLNFSVEAGTIVIQRVAARFILRRGKLTGCIVNRAFSGGGERLSTGTIAPDVERIRRAGAP